MNLSHDLQTRLPPTTTPTRCHSSSHHFFYRMMLHIHTLYCAHIGFFPSCIFTLHPRVFCSRGFSQRSLCTVHFFLFEVSPRSLRLYPDTSISWLVVQFLLWCPSPKHRTSTLPMPSLALCSARGSQFPLMCSPMVQLTSISAFFLANLLVQFV